MNTEFVDLFSSLTEKNQRLVIDLMRALITQANTSESEFNSSQKDQSSEESSSSKDFWDSIVDTGIGILEVLEVIEQFVYNKVDPS